MATIEDDAVIGDRYFELVRLFPLRPLRDDGDLDRAIGVIHALLDRNDLDPAEEDYLVVLGDIVRNYESVQHPLRAVSAAEMLRHLIDAKGISQTALAAGTGIAVSTISEILSGRRSLNLKHVAMFARYFHVGPGVFIGE